MSNAAKSLNSGWQSDSLSRLVVVAFTAALFMSALLLFSVQPMFARMILPHLGGSPSVWAVSLCFFQAVLLGGYTYAHLLEHIGDRRLALGVHLVLLTSAALALPFAVPSDTDVSGGNLYLSVVAILAVGVGLPFFAISANAPLLQSWFARSGHPRAADPYFLYGASNIGSLAALLAYPVVVEPSLGLASQAVWWGGGFVVLIALIGVSGMLGQALKSDQGAATSTETRTTQRTTWAQRGTWIGLAFVPSGLLVAFTSYLTTDIASAPFLWVLPLALFLSTFIFVFKDTPPIPHAAFLAVQTVAVVGALAGLAASSGGGWVLGVSMGFLAFFVTSMVCHRELYLARPDRVHLTEFYMWMSFGGVLGGVFAAIVAPQIFNSIHEFPLLLILGLAARPGMRAALGDSRERLAAVRLPLLLLAAIAICALVLRSITLPEIALRFAYLPVIAILGVLMVAASERPLRLVALAAVAGLSLVLLPSTFSRGITERGFFGVLRVVTSADGTTRALMHGTTLHGGERIKDKAGNPVTYPVPAAYYHHEGPLSRGIETARGLHAGSARPFAVGIVGLGAGAMACHSRASETWRFYEIDPVVVRIALNREMFTYLAKCRPSADIVLGDARLTVSREPTGTFDYLAIDAFSSDAVPVHLITREAIAMYLDRLTPSGILAMHVSNRHMNLEEVASATALSIPGSFVAVVAHVPPRDSDATPSRVVLVARSQAAMARVLAWPDAKAAAGSDVAPWTDDYSNVLAAIWRRYMR